MTQIEISRPSHRTCQCRRRKRTFRSLTTSVLFILLFEHALKIARNGMLDGGLLWK